MTVPAIVTARHPYLLTNPDEMGPTWWNEHVAMNFIWVPIELKLRSSLLSLLDAIYLPEHKVTPTRMEAIHEVSALPDLK